MIQTFDNKINKVGDDLKKSIKKNSTINISSSTFSIYGYDSLENELNKIGKFNFIYTTPFKSSDKTSKQFNLSKSISGTEFEITLKNELQSNFIAKKCVKWIKRKATFKSPKNTGAITDMLILDEDIYLGIKEFSSVGLGYKKDNSILSPILKAPSKDMQDYITQFNNVWHNKDILQNITDKVIDHLETLYKENSPEFIYYLILYHIFNEFLDDLNEDELANEKTGFKKSVIWNKLFDFQKDAVLGLINKLEKYNGAILADSVGLGKTFTALGVIKYYQERNKSILVLTPKKLGDNWNTFLGNYNDNILVNDRFNYDVLYHTDLLREKGYSNGMDLSRINWSNYDLIVIDESHNFRSNNARKERKTRYQKLLEDVIQKGVKTKVLMLSATPVNNKFNDLKNQLALAYEGKTDIIDEKLGVSQSIDIILRNTQKIFNEWMRLPDEKKTSKELLKMLNTNFDFFKLLDSVTIARSRKHIEKYYDISKIGNFPKRLKPVTLRPDITTIEDFIEIRDIYEKLNKLNMSLYSPFEYILPSKIKYYEELYDTKISDKVSLKQSNREKSLKTLMKINLLKRLESSVYSFNLTLNRFIKRIESIISKIESHNSEVIDDITYNGNSTVGDKIKIKIADLNTPLWLDELKHDLKIAKELSCEMSKITPSKDEKLNEIKRIIEDKLLNPINIENKKILIFTAFSDTANYLYENLKDFNLSLGLNSGKVIGSNENETTLKIDKNFNTLLSHFSPKSKELTVNNEIDILIATDCISEGQNLQDCDMLINYDIHWNPVRIIQRFGRIDRIGSKNEKIQLINFWPQISLDEYINLKSRVEGRMYMVDTTATGEDNVLTNESNDLVFRKKQLEKLQEEVIDLEDIDSTISLTDLGLNDFRMDLLTYLKEKGNLEDTSTGLHTIVLENENLKSGVIFVLKNIHHIDIDKTNQLHPFYIIYVSEDKEIIHTHIEAKKSLDLIRGISKNQKTPIKKAYKIFNEKTKDGRDMKKYSLLLNEAIKSIINKKDETMIDSLFNEGGTIIQKNEIKGINDFELIAFIVVGAENV